MAPISVTVLGSVCIIMNKVDVFLDLIDLQFSGKVYVIMN